VGQTCRAYHAFYEDIMNWFKTHKFEIALFCAALAVRLALFSFNFSHNNHELITTIHGDDGYYELSQNILAGNGFSFDPAPPYRPNPLRPPVWPYLIAFFAHLGGYWLVFSVEMILAALIPVLGMHVARRLVGERLSKFVGLALVFEPYSILLSFLLYTETAFTFFFLVFLIFFLRYTEKQSIRNAIWSGMFLGLACLIKPTVQYFPILIPLALLVLWRKNLRIDHLKHLCVFAVTFLLVIAPWLYRNHIEFGVWGMSAQPAFNVYVYLAPTVLAIENHTNFQTEFTTFVKKNNFDENSITLSNATWYKDEGMKVILAHKAALVKSVVISGITFFTHDGMLTILGYSGIQIPNIVSKPIISLVAHPGELMTTIIHYAQTPAVLILLLRLVWFVIFGLFVVGVVLLLKKKEVRIPALAAFFMVLYFAATTCINGLGVNARFRVPVNVFIFSFAIYALFVIKERISRNRT